MRFQSAIPTLFLLGVSALLCIAGTALAGPISLPIGVPLFFQFDNLEQVSPSNGIVVLGINGGAAQGNWGVMKLTSIQLGTITVPNQDIQGGGSIIFADGTTGQVSGIFYGINLTSATTATGGTLDLYWNDIGTIGALNGTTYPANAATATLFTTGTFLARINFASGIIPGDATTTIASTDLTTQGGTGFAGSFGNVNLTSVGPWSNALNGDWFHVFPNGISQPFVTRDVRFDDTFNVDNTAWNGTTATGAPITGLRSYDPVRSLNNIIPEPSTLVLLCIGLLGLGLYRRRK
jgi:hypothetical protein